MCSIQSTSFSIPSPYWPLHMESHPVIHPSLWRIHPWFMISAYILHANMRQLTSFTLTKIIVLTLTCCLLGLYLQKRRIGELGELSQHGNIWERTSNEKTQDENYGLRTQGPYKRTQWGVSGPWRVRKQRSSVPNWKCSESLVTRKLQHYSYIGFREEAAPDGKISIKGRMINLPEMRMHRVMGRVDSGRVWKRKLSIL